MEKISLKQAKPGMKLARPAFNRRGMMLCRTNTELTEDLIKSLLAKEVEFVTIKVDQATAEEIDNMIAKFQHLEGDPIMEKVKMAFVNRLKKGQ